MSVGARLHAKLELVAPMFAVTAERLWTSARVRDIYPVYLATMHMIVRAAVPLMQAARDRALELGEHDPLGAALAEYLTRHMREESGHDRWLLDDLTATGCDPGQLVTRMPSAKVASLVGAQYYWLHHHHPVAVLGHIAAIESYPPPSGFAERLRRATGHPAAAFRAIARHEQLDIHHRREFYELLDSLPLTPEHEATLGVSALHSLEFAIDVLAEIHDRVIGPTPDA